MGAIGPHTLDVSLLTPGPSSKYQDKQDYFTASSTNQQPENRAHQKSKSRRIPEGTKEAILNREKLRRSHIFAVRDDLIPRGRISVGQAAQVLQQ